jgi:hypothetical protein
VTVTVTVALSRGQDAACNSGICVGFGSSRLLKLIVRDRDRDREVTRRTDVSVLWKQTSLRLFIAFRICC